MPPQKPSNSLPAFVNKGADPPCRLRSGKARDWPGSRATWLGATSAILLVLLNPGLKTAEAGNRPALTGSQAEQEASEEEFRLKAAVELVVLYATVLDRDQNLVTGLPQGAFQVLQDGKPQTITQFSNRDLPVAMGILVDSSASMVPKRAAVNAAALALVEASNPEDEVFILNFKDTAELAQDFTNDIEALARGLSEVRMWGGTAVLDAVLRGIEHLRQATRDKKVLLVITDGEDDSSKIQLDELLVRLRKSDVTVYTIGILSEESSRSRRNAEKMLKAIAKESGGAPYFPPTLAAVQSLATQIAHDIRNQYVLAYPVPAGTRPGFHSIQVKGSSKSSGKLTVRTRPGYFYGAVAAAPHLK